MSIDVRPIAGSLGSEIGGVDLSRPLDDATYTAIRRVLVERQVIFFRDQAITPEQQIALSRTRFPWTQNWLNRSVQGGPEHDR